MAIQLGNDMVHAGPHVSPASRETIS
jgi:hypothetical protein